MRTRMDIGQGALRIRRCALPALGAGARAGCSTWTSRAFSITSITSF